MIIAIIIAVAVIFVSVYACCVAAGRADELDERERMKRKSAHKMGESPICDKSES